MNEIFVTRECLAKFFGLSLQRISQLVAQGMPKKDVDKYPLIACSGFYIKFLRNRTNDSTTDIAQEKLRLMREKAERAALENQKLRNKVIDADEIKQDLMRIIQKLKDDLLAIPGRLCHELTGKTEAEIKHYLDTEIKQSLTKTADQLDAMIEETESEANANTTESKRISTEGSSNNLENTLVSERG